MVELYANGQVNQYASTLVAMRGRYKLSGRDKRLLRSSTRVLAPRDLASGPAPDLPPGSPGGLGASTPFLSSSNLLQS